MRRKSMEKKEFNKIMQDGNSMFRGNQELIEDNIKTTSELLYYRYNCLLDVGFTQEQAFEIILPESAQIAYGHG